MSEGPAEEGSLLTWKRTLGAIAVLAVVIAAAYFLEVRLEEARFERENREARLFPFSSEETVALVVETPEGAFRLERADGQARGRGAGWSITSPVRTPADPRTAASLLWQVDSLRRLEALPDAGPPAAYGLGGPETHALTAVGPGARRARVEVGREVPTRPAVYARADGGPVVLVDRSVLPTLDLDLRRLRDLRLAACPPQAVVAMTWERPDPWGLLVVRQDPSMDAGWSLEAPVAAPADLERVARVADGLAAVRALEVAAEREEAEGRLADFGLDPPRVRARIETRDGQVCEVEFGSLAPAEAPEAEGPAPYRVYARNEGGAVFVVPGDLLKKVNAPAVEWRDRRLARVDRWDLDRVTVLGAVEGEHWVLERREDRTWTSPQAPGREFDWEEVDPYLDSLLTNHFVAFLDGSEANPAELGFDRPYLRVEMSEGDRVAWYELGARHRNPNLRHARLDGGEVGLVLYGRGAKALREMHRLFQQE